MSKKQFITVLCIGVVAVIGIFAVTGTSPLSFGGIATGTTTTYASSTASATAQLVLTANPGAQFRLLQNRNAVVVYLSCSTTSTGFLAGLGYPLAASATLIMDEEAGTMWCTDNIYGITAAATTSIGTMER